MGSHTYYQPLAVTVSNGSLYNCNVADFWKGQKPSVKKLSMGVGLPFIVSREFSAEDIVPCDTIMVAAGNVSSLENDKAGIDESQKK